MDLGTRIRQIREEQGLSQEELANLMQTSQSTISQLESGERNTTYRTLQKLAKALNVTVGHILGEEGGVDLTPEEEIHFREYRGLSPAARQQLREYLQFLKHRHPGQKDRTEER